MKNRTPSRNNKDQGISLGTIFDGIGETKDQLIIDPNQLKKHALVCGVTGSGKTNTCFRLAEELKRCDVPFMVLESCKSEYRSLLTDSDSFPDAMVYTAADDSIVPLRLNPFEIIKGVKVLAHIDALKAVFNASFEMYAPMPQVLEKCLILLYEQKGWDLTENRNSRLFPGTSLDDAPSQIFPTMKELYEIIEPVTQSYNYSERIGPDVSAALKARIGSLLTGSKERIFSTRRSATPQHLFDRPTVVEIKDLFSSDEKAFVSQILLLFLYEYRKASGASAALKHVLFVEDAHRLFGSCRQVDGEKVQLGSYFQNVFRNVFSEIGAYGQGIVISTQCPSDLPPDILNNSNLRLIHRLSTNKEVGAVSGAMYFNDVDRRCINCLSVGDALVYGENMEQPCRLRVPFRERSLTGDLTPEVSDEMVRAAMKQRDPGYTDKTSVREQFLTGCDPWDRKVGAVVAEDPTFRQTFNRFVMSMLNDKTQLVHFRAQIIHEVQRILGGRRFKVVAVTWCALVEASDRYFDQKGEGHSWFYDLVVERKTQWLNLLKVAFLPSGETRRISAKQLEQWKEDLVQAQKREQGPLPTCGPCTSKCLYRFEVSEVVGDAKVRYDFNASLNRKETPASESAAWFCRLLTERLIGRFDLDLAYCLAVHLIKDQQLSSDAQFVLLHKVRRALEGGDEGGGVTSSRPTPSES
jgi:hypothetical protein